MEKIMEDTLIDKVTNHETRLNEQHKANMDLSKTISTLKSESENIQKVAVIVNNLQEKMSNIQWPVDDIKQLTRELVHNNELRQHPKKDKIVHVHTGGRLLWTAIALAVVIVILIIGWGQTYSTLNEYRMTNIGWRLLKLDPGKKQLQLLQDFEQRYIQDPDKVTRYVEQEELNLRQQAEAKAKAAQAEQEARTWKQVAGDTANRKPSIPKSRLPKMKK